MEEKEYRGSRLKKKKNIESEEKKSLLATNVSTNVGDTT